MPDLVTHCDDLGFTIVAEPHEYYVDYKVYNIQSWGLKDEEREWSKWVESVPRGVKTLEEADVYLSGSVKWDHCSNWVFDEQDRCALHGCCRRDVERFGLMMVKCWDLTREYIPRKWIDYA